MPNPALANAPNGSFTLKPGLNVFTYTGPEVSLLTLLAPATGTFSMVSYRGPGGALMEYRPGQAGGERMVVPSGSQFSIVATGTAMLTW